MQQVFPKPDGVILLHTFRRQQGNRHRFFPQRIVPAVLEDDFIELPLFFHPADKGHLHREGPQNPVLPDLVFSDEHHIAVFPLGRRGNGFQRIGLQAVVRVQKDRPVLLFRLLQAAFNGCPSGAIGAGVLLMDHRYPGILGGRFVAQGGRAVGGTVIHQNNPEILHRLGKYGVQALRKKGLRLVHRDQYIEGHKLPPSHMVSQSHTYRRNRPFRRAAARGAYFSITGMFSK